MWLLLLLFKILCILTIAVLSFPFFLQITAMLNPFRPKEKKSEPNSNPSVAIIITAYKQLQVCYDLLKSIQKQSYPNYKVFIVADRCNPSDQQISDSNFEYLFPEQALDSKVKSIAHALENGADKFRELLILDPDNILSKDFLEKITKENTSKSILVQGNRLPKNLDSPTSCLDAAGEFFRNRMDRVVPSNLGISATIAGSGFLVDTPFYERFLMNSGILARANNGDIITGEDKELQNYIVEQGFHSNYVNDALLYDQKIKFSHQIERQRARWLSAYFKELPKAVGNILLAMAALRIKKALFFMISAYPPIFILALGTGILLTFSFILGLDSITGLLLLSGLLFVLNYFIALWASRAPGVVWRAFLFLPVFILKMFVGLFQMSKTKKDFLPTEHHK